MGCSEKDFCIKCDKGGKVLSCSDNSCPISVHERCLGFPAKFDNLGNFYCPYCSYRKATEESRQARENALLRKKALSNFIDMGMLSGDKHMREVGKPDQESEKVQNTGKENYNLGIDKNNKLDAATIQKNPVQTDEEQEDQSTPESIRRISLHKKTDMEMLGKENSVLSSKYDDNARRTQSHDRLVVVGHRTPSGPIVACGGDDLYPEEEGTEQHFQIVERRQTLLEHHKQFSDDQPTKTVDNDIEDGYFCEFPVGEKEGRENYLSCLSKSVDNYANPVGEDEDKIHREEEMEEQVQESISSFATDPAMPIALEEKEESESTDTSYRKLDPTSPSSKRVKRNDKRTDVNCLRRSRRTPSAARRANVEKIEDPTELKQVTEPSPGVRDVEQIVELNAPSELKQATESSPGFSRNLLPSNRRKKLPWKEDEEEMLMEGFRNYATTETKNVPWRKILEFGRHIFHDTRTPVDLKDKWRNLLAKDK